MLRRDGYYHFERILSDKALVYEGSVSQASLEEIQTVVNNDELLRLTQSKIPLHLYSVSWDELDLRIARVTGWQKLRFPDAESRKAFGQSLDPLLKWFQALPTKNRTEMTAEEGKNNCLPPRSEEAKLKTRERPARSTPVKGPPSLPDSYMLRIVLDQISPGVAKRTCAIVYPNGFYHLEKSREKHYSEGVYQPDIVNQGAGGKIKADVFEQFLDSTATAALRKLLDTPTLIASRHSTLPAGLYYTDADITMVFIPREGMVQQLAFTNYFGGDDVRTAIGARSGRTQHIDSAANLISPLQKWMKSNIESRKAARLKEAFGNNCTSATAQALPSEISSELAQVVPEDLDSVTTEPGAPIPTEAKAAGSSTAPSPTVTSEDLVERADTVNEPGLSLRVTTRMVVLDVIATEKDGTPIPDLHLSDIQVLEDGRPQNVKLFSRASSDSAHSEKKPAPPLPPDVYSNRPVYSRPAGPLVLLLLDGVNTAGSDQVYARQQLLQYVRTLKADQRVAIFALTTDLFLLQDFTSDPAILRAALEKYSASDSFLLTRGAPAQVTPQMAAILQLSPALETLIRFNQESAVNASDERVRVTPAALHSIARAMVGYPGRKNLIWVSSGFPVSIQLGGDPVGMGLSRNYADDLAAAAAQLSQARVAVYPVDARGLIANLQDTPSDKTSSGAFTDQIVPTIQSPSSSSFGAEELTRTAPLVRDSHIAMAEIAQDTGGRAFYDDNNLAAAVEAGVADGNSYYTLGYYPENKNWDGKFRKISIKAERKDIRLRYRSGYYAIDSLQLTGPTGARPEKTRVQELVQAIKEPLPATGVSFWAHLIPPRPGDSSTYVEFLVDSKTISFAETALNHDCNIDFATFTVVSNGKLANTAVKNVAMSLTASQYTAVRKKGLPFRLQINSLPDHGNLRLAVRDNRTGLLGTLVIPITPAQ
ncbi:MAG: VWA domain-containing protein [Acidobacteriia bacterium]|nr:VWA domain-containing protein [Terriglobia bacterium]